LIVGSEARTRVSSLIAPFLIGTLKSTRMKTFLPFRSRSLTLTLAMTVFLESGTPAPGAW